MLYTRRRKGYLHLPCMVGMRFRFPSSLHLVSQFSKLLLLESCTFMYLSGISCDPAVPSSCWCSTRSETHHAYVQH